MAEVGGRIRLFVTGDLGPGAEIALNADQSHYLFTVMRLEPGARVAIFNGRDGEWLAEVVQVGRRGGRLAAREPGRPQRRPPDLWLLFAPIKKARTDFIVEKATELGAARIQPVFTRLTNAGRLRADRLARPRHGSGRAMRRDLCARSRGTGEVRGAARRLEPFPPPDVLRRDARGGAGGRGAGFRPARRPGRC